MLLIQLRCVSIKSSYLYEIFLLSKGHVLTLFISNLHYVGVNCFKILFYQLLSVIRINLILGIIHYSASFTRPVEKSIYNSYDPVELKLLHRLPLGFSLYVAPWCSSNHYCTTSFNVA